MNTWGAGANLPLLPLQRGYVMQELRATSTFICVIRGWELYERGGLFFRARERKGKTQVRPMGRAAAKKRALRKEVTDRWSPQQN